MSSRMVLTNSTDPLGVIDRANLAQSTKRQYKHALRRYFRETGATITDIDALIRYGQI